MDLKLAHICLLVDDYDTAIEYYTTKLGFKLISDIPLSEFKRWVLVSPSSSSCNILLARAADEDQKKAIGNQSGGRVFLFLHTSHFENTYQKFLDAGVEFTEAPRSEPYGKVVVFRDIYGNKWDLIESK